jgi:hypothetical protein
MGSSRRIPRAADGRVGKRKKPPQVFAPEKIRQDFLHTSIRDTISTLHV